MDPRRRTARVLGIIGAALLLVSLLDLMEGFPLVLAGGALMVLAARLAASRWFRLLGVGLCLAVVGTGALLALSAKGGFGGTSGIAPVWGLTALPYPAGLLLLLVGTVLLHRQLWRRPGVRQAS
jgi:hypothetical protein